MAGIMDWITGKAVSGKNDDAAQKALQQAQDAYNGVTPPTLSPVQLKHNKFVGAVTPEQLNAGADVQYDPTAAHTAAAALAGPSAMEGVSTDPRLKEDQLSSIGALQDLAAHGGVNLADRANLARIQDQNASADRGRRDAILANEASRGMGGSGNELLAQLQSSQAATDRSGQQGLDVAGQAQQRALQAMMEGGQLAGSVRNQDFGEQAQKAAAADAIQRFNSGLSTSNNQFNASAGTANDQFNAGNALRTGIYNRDTALGVARANTGANNQAQYYNSVGEQRAADQGTAADNQSTMYNARLPQQDFQNQMGIAAGKSGVAQAGINYYSGQSAQDRAALKQTFGGLGQLGTSLLNKTSTTTKSDGSGDTSTGTDATPGGISGSDSGGDAGVTAAHGGIVPGVPKVPGDSPVNDTVTAHVSPGEMIVPRTTTMDIMNQIGNKNPGKTSRASDPMDINAFLRSMGHTPKIGPAHDFHPHILALKSLMGTKE